MVIATASPFPGAADSNYITWPADSDYYQLIFSTGRSTSLPNTTGVVMAAFAMDLDGTVLTGVDANIQLFRLDNDTTGGANIFIECIEGDVVLRDGNGITANMSLGSAMDIAPDGSADISTALDEIRIYQTTDIADEASFLSAVQNDYFGTNVNDWSIYN